ncbi:MAG TPA: nucleoside triphosphate pyrophosphohydrolase [Drouetiella sp.]
MSSNLESFIKTIARLRAPDGCPWDLEQTHESLARYVIEEAYEVQEAIHSGDPSKLKEELGDLLLQVVLHAQVAKDAGEFDIEDVAQGINEKMIRRHPHVFSDSKVEDSNAVKGQWEEIKKAEKAEKSGKNGAESAIDGVPIHMPGLLQALKISEKAVTQGFEWENEGQVWDKLDSEIQELKDAISHPDMTKPEKQVAAKREVDLEMGDVLFTLVNIGRWHGLNPEESLILAIEKFKQRFRKMEALSAVPLKTLAPKQLDDLWNSAKADLKKQEQNASI